MKKLILTFIVFCLMFSCSKIDKKPDRIEISPQNIAVRLNSTKQFYAEVYDDDNELIDDADIVWTLSDSIMGSIDNSGLFTAGNTETAGDIIAVSEDVEGRSSITVSSSLNPSNIQRIDINPASAEINSEESINFTVNLYNIYDELISGSVSWSVSDSELGSINQNGVFTAGYRSGEGYVQASANGKNDRANVRVIELNGDIQVTVSGSPLLINWNYGNVYRIIVMDLSNNNKIVWNPVCSNNSDCISSPKVYGESIANTDDIAQVNGTYESSLINGHTYRIAVFQTGYQDIDDTDFWGQVIYTK